MNAKIRDDLNTQEAKTEEKGPTVPARSVESWKDPKRYLWLLGPALPGIGLAALTGYALAPKKLKALAWTGPALVHGMIPALDRAIGEDQSNPPESAVGSLEQDKYYSRIVKAFIPTQYAMTFMGAWLASRKKTPMEDKIGLALTVGAINGVGINTAHELGHKSNRFNKVMAMAALAPTGYTHFVVEHNFGHHKRVATPEDPASSRMGESFWSLDNELLQGWAMSAGFFGATTLVCGPRAVPFLATQAVYGASLLESVNYIEHYGLLRQKDNNGKYERTQPEHSWNSNHIVTNLFLYQLQRHSDHHAHPQRSYQALRHFEKAPQLPGGYASMLVPAYVPQWWYETMDKRVIEHYKGDMSKINWDPYRKAELMAKYADYAAEIAAKAEARREEDAVSTAEKAA